MTAISFVTITTNGGIHFKAAVFPRLKIWSPGVPPGHPLVVAPAALNHYASRFDLGRCWIGRAVKRRTSPATAATPLATRERIAAERWMCESSFAGAVLETAVEQPARRATGRLCNGGTVCTPVPQAADQGHSLVRDEARGLVAHSNQPHFVRARSSRALAIASWARVSIKRRSSNSLSVRRSSGGIGVAGLEP